MPSQSSLRERDGPLLRFVLFSTRANLRDVVSAPKEQVLVVALCPTSTIKQPTEE